MAVSKELSAAIANRSGLADRKQQEQLVSEMLVANPEMGRQLIDSKLSVDEFFQGLNGRGLGSDQHTVCDTQFSLPLPSSPFQDEAHAVESS